MFSRWEAGGEPPVGALPVLTPQGSPDPTGGTPAAAVTSNFRIDQHDLVESVGAIADRVHRARTAADDAQRACQRAVIERRPVVLMLPVDIQPQQATNDHPTQSPLPVFEP